jgi:hypothetical protein
LRDLRVSLQDQERRLSIGERELQVSNIGTVIYRRPKPFDSAVDGDCYQRRHASNEWAEAVEGFLGHIPAERWINHPVRNYSASQKVVQLVSARECGLVVPSWLVTTDAREAEDFLRAHDSQVVAKPMASGFIERAIPEEDSLIYTSAIDESHIILFDRLPGCPVLFQARVVKDADVRLVVVDDQSVAVSLRATESDGSQRLDIRRDNMSGVQYEQIAVPRHVNQGVARFMRRYGLRFGALDFAIDAAGNWSFFEVNPNGQWAWLDLEGVCDIGGLFIHAIHKSFAP